MSDVLSARALNRATLARQHLLAPTDLPALDLVEHLGGMQAQAPLAPYVGLWTRRRAFDPGELSALVERRQVARLHLMRNTLHLASARDALGWRGVFGGLHAAQFRAHFGPVPPDRDALVTRTAALLAERPRTRAELGRALARWWPDTDPDVLAHAATHHVPLLQVPPRGLWGRSGRATWAVVEDWLGAPLTPVPVDRLVLRYLGAFGPAGVDDVQAWSGLSRLREVVERLPLRAFRDEDGRPLHDLPDAPRPAATTPAPPRFLPAYDNLLLSHADRRRVIPHPRPVPLPPGNGAAEGTVLVDGLWQGTWRRRRGALHVQLFTPVGDPEALRAEGERLCAFLDPDATPDVVLCRATT